MARKFCVMTVGRSGSTSLMEALERCDDIAIPSKNITCEDNELVHPKRIAEHIKRYSELCNKTITNQQGLIHAFFELNDAFAYAGFKSMPNRHPDYANFIKSKDLQFITLRRRDIASTAASFLRAGDSGSWRRHGEPREESWTFDMNRHAERVKGNVAYIFQSHALMSRIDGAIHLYYEDLCQPDYSSARLDKYFNRPIRLENPRPPTSGSQYMENWELFSGFVDEVWRLCKRAARKRKSGKTAGRKNITAAQAKSSTFVPDAQAPVTAEYASTARGRRVRARRTGAASNRVFYAWELGMDLGHLLRFLAPALKLRERGNEVYFAVRDLSNAESTLGYRGFPLMQAPIWIANVGDLPKMTISYAEIALRYGFISYPGLKAMVKAWRELYRYVRPGLVLTDHSPTALLAARTLGLKCAPIGSGFFNPPLTNPLPNMRYWNQIPAGRIAKPDAIATSIANQVIADMGGPRLESMADLFRTHENFLCTFKELDHYPDRGPARYWGPTFEVEQGVELPWPAGEGKRIFAYLKPRHSHFAPLLQALQDSGHRVLAYTPGINREHFEKFKSERMVLSRTPLKLKTMISECDLVICHGGPGTVTASLLAGVPLLILPTQMEQVMSTKRVVQLGAALMSMPAEKNRPAAKDEAGKDAAGKDKKEAEPPPLPDYPAILNRLLTEETFRAKAGEFAQKYRNFSREKQARVIATRVEELLRS